MGKKQFLRELNRKLRTLEKSERRRYLDDYEEMIADMVEGGLTEEEAVSRLGSPEKSVRRFWKIQNRKAADGLMCREPCWRL